MILTVGLFGSSPAWADNSALISQFSDFQYVSEVGVSGLQSSYYPLTQAAGGLCPSSMPVLGTSRVYYPPDVGTVPSPGYYSPSEAAIFDEGMLGVKVDANNNLVVQLATAMNPRTGYYDSGWATQYGQGDMFITVKNGTNVTQFALLNTWARNANGGLLQLGGGFFGTAQAFHVGNEGDLVQLRNSSDVTATGGGGAYSQGYTPPPVGLDYRVFADGGIVSPASLTITPVSPVLGGNGTGFDDLPVTWYVETWTVAASALSTSSDFEVSLHTTFSCGNDQIGLDAPISIKEQAPGTVPAPGAVVLGMIGLGSVGYFRRRKA
jgi:hypothetical protein